jgi:hypothetical protein
MSFWYREVGQRQGSTFLSLQLQSYSDRVLKQDWEFVSKWHLYLNSCPWCYRIACSTTRILTSKNSRPKCGKITNTLRRRKHVTSNQNKISTLSWDVTRTHQCQCHRWLYGQWKIRLFKSRDSREKLLSHFSNIIDLRDSSHLIL